MLRCLLNAKSENNVMHTLRVEGTYSLIPGNSVGTSVKQVLLTLFENKAVC